ncbi:hypothetical protein Dda_2579 [Drechslerella dactyloides]|uniref:Uncharacterized protein n=1 Tax=Drechslerella dactyloides TaxID=74499 RepID=A0AAD6J228_DREDA|nr:hypothetical protein Dda_2579 [Drechslerella dactyloides]
MDVSQLGQSVDAAPGTEQAADGSLVVLADAGMWLFRLRGLWSSGRMTDGAMAEEEPMEWN